MTDGLKEGASSPTQTQPELISNLPDGFDGGSAQPYRPDMWWRVFEDPKLDSLLSRALLGNLDLAEASARLRAAQAEVGLIRSGLSPQIEAVFEGDYEDSPTGATLPGQNKRQGETAYGLSLAASYEIDLWGRLENLSKASQADAYAAQSDLEAARLSVIAEAIETYFELVDTRRQIALLKQGIAVLDDRVTFTESRYRQGLVSSFELYQIRQELRGAQALIPQNEVSLAEIEGRMAVLVGGYSHEMSHWLEEPLTPKLAFDDISVGLPSSLLIQRPDVMAASSRMEAARLRVGARRAEQFPALSLSSGIGTQDENIAGLFDILDRWVGSLGVGLTAPLLQGGRIKANIELADAEYAQASATYARTVLVSYQEVSAALKTYDAQRRRYESLYQQLSEAKKTVNLQSQRFKGGLGDYAAYLDARLQQYQIEASVSAAGRDVAMARLSIHRALGGDWINIDKAVLVGSENSTSGDS